MAQALAVFWAHAKGSIRDLLPIVLVIAGFQFLVLGQPLDGLFSLAMGGVIVVIGLTLFVYGLELGLFPIGEALATALARKASVFWLISVYTPNCLAPASSRAARFTVSPIMV